MKKLIISLLLILVINIFTGVSFAASNYKTHLNRGNKLIDSQKYSEALEEFEEALNIANTNQDVRSALINAYLLRADKAFDSGNEWGRAANDYRSALFYLNYYHPEMNDETLISKMQYVEKKLNICFKHLSFKKSAQNRFLTAELLRFAGLYAAAGYEYKQAALDKKFKEKCDKKLILINCNNKDIKNFL